ncbi:Methyl-accepting chemotaxis protein (MCP) signalling domain-containing protein [Paenibacillus sp. UNC496MF]|uniref:methyl-accepting chemotaxis protein n=1 Tax=Paenibacillus sp. UNC496MF TaxID=1502753 RepID=UPI0008ED39AD|nr:methyl-accepting chemotaxis protein [Paenibacillus sp. UNC496MF]SFJ84161.1 Methyl-accepting chemotaxis protein (MCP) signalling domain-containing protein [Paenibacillus sp. UNC496MF]
MTHDKEAYLQAIAGMMDTMLSVFPEEATLILIDETGVRAYRSSGIDVEVPIGTPRSALAGTISEKAFEQGRTFREERGPERFGVSYVGTAVPLRLAGEVVGVLTSAVLNHRLDAIRGSSESLAASVQEMAATSNGIAAAFGAISGEMGALADKSEALNRDIDGIQSIIGVVQELADTSNLLGLNASIEAAHAGEYGRGFSVVAGEIRRMAAQSRDASRDIREQLGAMQARLKAISADIDRIKRDMGHHAESVMELDEAFEHVASTAGEMLEKFTRQ